MLYRTIKRLIERGKTEGLREKIDVLYLAGSLTEEQYKELVELLGGDTDEVGD